MNYVLVPADKAANNVVVVWRLYYINTLKRELVDTNAYNLQPSLSERVVVDGHGCHTALHFGVKAKEDQDRVLSGDKQADIIDAFKTTSIYFYDILNIDNVYLDTMVSQIYPSEPQLNKANTSDTEAAFLDLQLSISNNIVSTKIYDKHDDFDFEIVNLPFLDGDAPRSTSMESISLNSFVLLEHLAMLLTLTLAINC